jgi:hypothetical protein
MHDSFAALLQQPSARRYKQLRTQLLAAQLPEGSSLVHLSLQLAELERVLSLEPRAAADLAASLLPAGLLSLKLHRLGGMASLACGDTARAELHRFTYDALCQAITATGDGTRRRPLLVTYASDALELLLTRGLNVRSQSLVEDKSQRFDVLLCDNEREFWFDITDLLPATATIEERVKRPVPVAQMASVARGGPAKKASAPTRARAARKRAISRSSR